MKDLIYVLEEKLRLLSACTVGLDQVSGLGLVRVTTRPVSSAARNAAPAEVSCFSATGLRDWNVRVMLYRLWRGRAKRQSWAVEADPGPGDCVTWDVWGVPVRVENFVAAIGQRLSALVVPR
jgi:hypothetical protein